MRVFSDDANPELCTNGALCLTCQDGMSQSLLRFDEEACSAMKVIINYQRSGPGKAMGAQFN